MMYVQSCCFAHKVNCFFFDVVVVVVAWLLKLPAGKDENENDDADDVSG